MIRRFLGPSLAVVTGSALAGVGAVQLCFHGSYPVVQTALILMTTAVAFQLVLLVVEFLPKSRARLYIKLIFGITLIGGALARCIEVAQALYDPTKPLGGVNFEDPVQLVIRAAVFGGGAVGLTYYYVKGDSLTEAGDS